MRQETLSQLDLQIPGVPTKKPARTYLSCGIVLVEPYRYRLWRTWNPELPRAVFIMLNPSTATAITGTTEDDDPTITTCVGFGELWGCGGLEVVNAFGLKATDPSKLYDAAEPIGPENDRHILDVVAGRSPPAGWNGTGAWSPASVGPVVVAWGNHGVFKDRDREVMRLLAGAGIAAQALGMNKNGTPWHPLYRKRTTPLVAYVAR